MQDNGPGIVKKQIPLIFGKLLYGSKFHRLRMSRGQQGIGISAAGMYGVLTTGKPVKIISKISKKSPAHYYEIQIDTKNNKPEILNGHGEGVDIPPGEKGSDYIAKHGIEWVDVHDGDKEVVHGTRVTIELEGAYKRGRGSVDEYLEQTAIANPHVRLHYLDPEGNEREFERSTQSPAAGAEGNQAASVRRRVGPADDDAEGRARLHDLAVPDAELFARQPQRGAEDLRNGQAQHARATCTRIGRHEADALYQAIQQTKISAPATDCISPIGEELLLKGLHQCRARRVLRRCHAAAVGVSRQSVFDRSGDGLRRRADRPTGVARSADRIARAKRCPHAAAVFDQHVRRLGRRSGGKDPRRSEARHPAIARPTEERRNRRAARRHAQRESGRRPDDERPALCQPRAAAISARRLRDHANDHGHQLAFVRPEQSRNSLPSGPVTIMVHMASVWVPFTSESKEAIAGYPEIQKEMRLALQAVGRKLGMYLRRRIRVKQEGERRNIFLRYLGEVATAVSEINRANAKALYEKLLLVAKKKTAEADVVLGEDGKPIEEAEAEDYGGSVLIVDHAAAANAPTVIAHRSAGQGRRLNASIELWQNDARKSSNENGSTAAATPPSSRRATRKRSAC